MQIICDNPDIANELIGETLKSRIELSNLPNDVNDLCKHIFTKERLYCESKIDDFWNYLLVNEYSNESQFDIINKLISKNYELPDKILLLASEGKGFHGFRNRPWSTEKGNIHLTVYFKPQISTPNFHVGLLIVAAVAVLKTIDSIPDLYGKAQTKWVNDIVINQSKVCGIITQSFSTGNKISGAVVGIGLNVLTEPKIELDKFTNSVTSIKKHTSSDDCNLNFVLNNLIKSLSEYIIQLQSGKFKKLLQIYRERSAVIGKNVEIYSDPVNGISEKILKTKVVDINENLELIVSNSKTTIKNGRLTFAS